MLNLDNYVVFAPVTESLVSLVYLALAGTVLDCEASSRNRKRLSHRDSCGQHSELCTCCRKAYLLFGRYKFHQT